MTPALLLYNSLPRLCQNVLAFKKHFGCFGFFRGGYYTYDNCTVYVDKTINTCRED